MRRLTAYEIAGNPDDIIATHAGPDNAGKYCGFITRGEEGRYRILISTEPIFDTAKAAEDAMRDEIIAVTTWVENDLKDPENQLVKLLTSEEGPVVCQIVAAAQSAD
jgi:hypothetical protein